MFRTLHWRRPWVSPAVLSLLLVLVLALAVGDHTAAAQATPPTRFFGSVLLDHRPAAPGTLIVARVGAQVCGSTVVTTAGEYVLDVASTNSLPGCATTGASVTFTINDRHPARETAAVLVGGFIRVELTAETVPPAQRTARVVVERWVQYQDEPCASPAGDWCIQTVDLPAAHEPFARYRMIVLRVTGTRAEATPWISVTPNAPTASVTGSAERGVVSVLWEHEAPWGGRACQGVLSEGWCRETIAVTPPRHATVWYRLLVFHPNGSVGTPTGFIQTIP